MNAVLRSIDDPANHIDSIVCLGDVVGYNANPNECTQIIREHNVPCVAGNHDRAAAGLIEPDDFSEVARYAIFWTRRQLTMDNRDFLAGLTMVRTLGEQAVLVHAGLHPEPNDEVRIMSELTAAETFAAMNQNFPHANVCFFGHTHRTAAYEYDAATRPVLPENGTLVLQPDRRYLINPGSVGQSRDHDPRAAFAIYDSDARTVTFKRVDYDILASREKVSRTPGLLPRPTILGRLAHLIGIK